MDPTLLARWQFTITSVYHFFFVPLTLGLGLFVALMQTQYVRSGKEVYKKMTKFWGKLFMINFAMGVATGMVMEFQFGMNWSEYARFMGDIFGAPLAIEALLTFFLESVFIGLWIFGWDKLPKRIHLMSIWLVVIGSWLSAFFILSANSFMQEPVGFELAADGSQVFMTDFVALITNTHLWVQFPHVITSGMSTAAFFVLGISAWHLMTKKAPGYRVVFQKSFRWSAIYGLVAILLVLLIGHTQMQHMAKTQPMKVAAAEGLWDSEESAAGLSLLTIGTLDGSEEVFSIRVPYVLSILAFNDPNAGIQGMYELQDQYEEEFGDLYGPDMNYAPPVAVTYWSFRAMVGAGTAMLALAGWALLQVLRESFEKSRLLLRLAVFAIALPFIANSTGWILAEVGRQPWIVFGLFRVQDSASPNVTSGMLVASLIAYTLVYIVLIVADVFLLSYFARTPENVFNTKNQEPVEGDVEMAF